MSRKSIIVTGGASGIGLGITKYFASEGHQIAVLDINHVEGASAVKAVASEYPKASLIFRKCDVSSWQEQCSVFAEVFQEHSGKLDVVMANAGISEQGASSLAIPGEESPSEPNLKALNVNLVGVIYTVKLATHYINRSAPNSDPDSKGTIICTASGAGIYPFPVAPIYSATKAGVIALVRSMARPLERHKIQINALAPCVLETNIAPDKALFKNMILTPISTLTRAVSELIANPKLTGVVVEVHGDKTTVRATPEYVDEDSRTNFEMFWSLGYA